MVRPPPSLPTLFGAAACALASSLAVAWAAPAVAAVPDDLEWTAPRECPSKAEITARVGRLIGPAHRGAAADALRARTVVSKDDRGGFHGEVSLAADPDAPARRIDGDSCEAVSEAIVLILAIAVDPDAAMAADTSRVADAPSDAFATPAPSAPAAADRPAASAASRARPFAVTGAGIVDSGLFGVMTPGAELAVGVRAPHVSFDLAGSWLSSTRATLAQRPSEGTSASALQVGGRSCGAFGGGPLTAGPCLGALLSVISAHGFGAAQLADRSTALLLGLAGARASYRLAPAAALVAELDAAIAAQRPTFVIDNAGAVARVPLATARLTAGVEMRF